MKPTKEQLADPKWWNTHSDNAKYCYRDRMNNSIAFKLTECLDRSYELLAKRPEQWVPEVGEMCEVWVENAEYWAKITVLAVDKDTIVWRNGTDRKSYRGTRISNARPIKTQREEFMDKAMSIFKGDNMELYSVVAGALYDAGCRFNLTEKDGE